MLLPGIVLIRAKLQKKCNKKKTAQENNFDLLLFTLTIVTHHASTKGAIPVSNESVGHHEGDGVWVGPPHRFYSDGNMSEGHLIIVHTDLKENEAQRRGL